MRVRALNVLLLVCVALACDPGDRPKEPVWGKQACEHCAMLLADREHGAQVVTTSGERLFFDEIGCLVAWTLAHPDAAAHRWVRTADTRVWLPPEAAGFEPRDRTPMGFGFVAVAPPGRLAWADVTAGVQRMIER
jgi:copper chaperone NosL